MQTLSPIISMPYFTEGVMISWGEMATGVENPVLLAVSLAEVFLVLGFVIGYTGFKGNEDNAYQHTWMNRTSNKFEFMSFVYNTLIKVGSALCAIGTLMLLLMALGAVWILIVP